MKTAQESKSWPTGREFKGLSLASCNNASRKKMGVTDTPSVPSSRTTLSDKQLRRQQIVAPPNPRVGGWGAEMAWIHNPFMRIEKRRSKNNNYHTYAIWTCTVWCAAQTNIRMYVCQHFFNTTCEKKTSCAFAIFKEIRMNSDCYISKHSLKVSKGKQPRKINPGPPGENSKD